MGMANAKRRANIAGRSPLREAQARPAQADVRERARAGARGDTREQARAGAPGDAQADALREDAALFREATRDVRPLAHDDPPPPRAKPPPRARFARADRLAILDESLQSAADDPYLAGGEIASYARAGVQDSVLRKLRRGQYRVQADLDLHGLTVREAKAALRDFLAEALDRGLTCVRIVHGKGLRSGPRGPVLKYTVSALLQRSARVLAFVSARSVDGGTGAVYALLSPPAG